MNLRHGLRELQQVEQGMKVRCCVWCVHVVTFFWQGPVFHETLLAQQAC